MSTQSTATSRTPATAPMGPTGRLAHWLEDLTLEAVPRDVQARAKSLMLDGIACALVGAQLPWSRVAVETVVDFEGKGESPIIGWDLATSPPAAALLNGTFIQGFELDDFHPLGPLHSASVVLPALFASMTRSRPVRGSDFLMAAIAGFEVGPRVGMALHGAQMLSRGWHSGSVFGPHAAAAATGVLLGLDAGRIEDALGLAATQSAGLMAAQFEAMSKRMHHGFSARNGFYAAKLAAGGYTGIKRVYEREYGGFLSVFGEGHAPDPTQITSGLGERWETMRIVVKPYAAMGALHAPLDAIFDILAKKPLQPELIERIDIDLSHAAYHHGWWRLEKPITPIGAQMNVAYAVAVAILDDAVMVKQFTPERINRDDVWSLIPKIEAHHDPEFDNAGGSARRARIRIRLTTGETIEQFVASTRSVTRPLTNDEIAKKYRVLTSNIVNHDRQAAIERAVNELECLDDASDLLGLLAPSVSPPF
jgi:aconitate decarboxylase